MKDRDLNELTSWFTSNRISLLPNLLIVAAVDGSISIKSVGNISINQTVAQIPKRSILSKRTTSLPSSFSSNQFKDLPPSIFLSLCLLHELLLGPKSPWSTYIKFLPNEIVSVAVLWNSKEVKNWIRGTDLEIELNRLGFDYESLQRIYATLLLPSLPPSHYPTLPTLSEFLWSYSMVSSRSFQVDAYHTLALVPLADLFNHENEELQQVHFASDWNVCESCGKFDICLHDDDDHDPEQEQRRGKKEEKENDDDSCEIFSNSVILKGEEVFNTYGQLSNPKLLMNYGFKLEANDYDRITFNFYDVVNLGGKKVEEEEWKKVLKLWKTTDEEENLLTAYPTIAEESELLYFDAEAKLSIGLWLLLALTHLESPSTTQEKLKRLERLLFHLSFEESGSQLEEDQARDINVMIRAVKNLCEMRRRLYYEPNLTGSEIFLLAETAEDPNLRMAMEFSASERLLLDSVKSTWCQLLD